MASENFKVRTKADSVHQIKETELASERGLATVIALIALTLFGLIALYLSLTSTTAVRISDNYESLIAADFAARAGLNHAREAMRGIGWDDLLKGPDGTNSTDSTYLAKARSYGFRNLLSWNQARSLNISDPSGDVSLIPDDGLVNTGKISGTNGTPIIPLTGIALTAPNPDGSGTIITSRYFVKVANNYPEDANPFLDTDNIVVVRSMGVARTIREAAGGLVHRNSVAVYDAKFKRDTSMDLQCPVVVDGPSVVSSGPNMYSGNSFRLNGQNSYGIGTIPIGGGDLNTQLTTQLTKNQQDNITGADGAKPSVGTMPLNSDQQQNLKDPNYLYYFANNLVPSFADNIAYGNQSWHGGSEAPNLGTVASPKVTVVNGDLDISGDISGAGILLVRGKLSGNGRFIFNGLVLVIGAGDMDLGGLNHFGITGGVFIANVSGTAGNASFGAAKLSISGQCNITSNADSVTMGVRLLPALQLSWREVKSDMDP